MFAILTSLTCFFVLLVLIVLLLIAAALMAQSRRTQPAIPQPERRVFVQRHDVVATAPFEALRALSDRLHEIQRHLPPDDARWLASYLNDLRNVTDDVYWELNAAQEPQRSALLTRLAHEVEQLDRLLTARLGATLGHEADRGALEAQLDQLRRSISQGE